MEATNMVMGIIAVLSVFGSNFGMFYVFIAARNRERLALIEKGKDASIFRKEPLRLTSLKWGLLILSVGIGVLVGSVFGKMGIIPESLAITSCSLIFGGIGLLTFYMITKNHPDIPID